MKKYFILFIFLFFFFPLLNIKAYTYSNNFILSNTTNGLFTPLDTPFPTTHDLCSYELISNSGLHTNVSCAHYCDQSVQLTGSSGGYCQGAFDPGMPKDSYTIFVYWNGYSFYYLVYYDPVTNYLAVYPFYDIPQICTSQTTETNCVFYPSCKWTGSACVLNTAVDWDPNNPNTSTYGFTTQDFGLLGNMFRDVIVYLFYPDANNITNQMNNVKFNFSTKSPFAYVLAIQTLINSVSVSSSDSPAISVDNPFSTSTPKSQLVLLDFDETKSMVGTTTWDIIQTVIGYLLWIGAFILIWETIHKGHSTKL